MSYSVNEFKRISLIGCVVICLILVGLLSGGLLFDESLYVRTRVVLAAEPVQPARAPLVDDEPPVVEQFAPVSGRIFHFHTPVVLEEAVSSDWKLLVPVKSTDNDWRPDPSASPVSPADIWHSLVSVERGAAGASDGHPRWMAVVSSAAIPSRDHMRWLHQVQDDGVQVVLYYNKRDPAADGRPPSFPVHPQWIVIQHGPVLCSECYVYIQHLILFYDQLAERTFFLQDDTDDSEFADDQDHHLFDAVAKIRAIRQSSDPPQFLPLCNKAQGMFDVASREPFEPNKNEFIFSLDWWALIGLRDQAANVEKLTAWRNGLFLAHQTRLYRFTRAQYYALYQEIVRWSAEDCPCYTFEKIWQEFYGSCPWTWTSCQDCPLDCGSCTVDWDPSIRSPVTFAGSSNFKELLYSYKNAPSAHYRFGSASGLVMPQSVPNSAAEAGNWTSLVTFGRPGAVQDDSDTAIEIGTPSAVGDVVGTMSLGSIAPACNENFAIMVFVRLQPGPISNQKKAIVRVGHNDDGNGCAYTLYLQHSSSGVYPVFAREWTGSQSDETDHSGLSTYMTAGQYHLIAATWSNGELNVYIDSQSAGVSFFAASDADEADTNPCEIGYQESLTDNNFDVYLDELMFFNAKTVVADATYVQQIAENADPVLADPVVVDQGQAGPGDVLSIQLTVTDSDHAAKLNWTVDAGDQLGGIQQFQSDSLTPVFNLTVPQNFDFSALSVPAYDTASVTVHIRCVDELGAPSAAKNVTVSIANPATTSTMPQETTTTTAMTDTSATTTAVTETSTGADDETVDTSANTTSSTTSVGSTDDDSISQTSQEKTQDKPSTSSTSSPTKTGLVNSAAHHGLSFFITIGFVSVLLTF